MQVHPIWRKSDFLKLWCATTVSQIGTQVSFIALPLIAVIFLKATALEVSILNAIDFLPAFLFSLPIGVWVDRRHRRPIMIVSDLTRAIVLLTIPVTAFFGAVSIWELYGVIFIVGALSIPFDVSYQSYLPSLVDEGELVDGNAALELSQSGSRIVGPSLAGFLISSLTAPIAIAVDALSYLGSAIFLVSIRRNEPPLSFNQGNVSSQARLISQINEGIQYVIHHQFLRHFAMFAAFSNLGWSLIEGILMVYAVRDLHLGPGLIGIVFTVANIGLISAASISGRLNKRFKIGRVMIFACAMQGLGVLFISLAVFTMPLLLLAAGLLVRSFGIVTYGVSAISLRQAITPDEMRGRISATMRFISWSTIPIGSLLGGALATWFGLSFGIWIGATIYLLAVILISLSPVRSLHSLTED